MKYSRKVLCLESYHEDNDEFWTAGVVYDAMKHRDGTWSIETNFGNEGRVGEGRMLSDFEGSFSDVTDGVTLLDAVRLAYNKYFFTIEDKNSEGQTMEIFFQTPSDAFLLDYVPTDVTHSAEDYVEKEGHLGVCELIAEALRSFAQDESMVERASSCFAQMKEACTVLGKCVVEGALDEMTTQCEKELEM